MEKNWEVFGWYGTVAILSAYFLNSFGIISSSGVWYQLLNITGAIGIVVISYKKKAFQPMTLNIVWTLVGLAALLKIIFF